MLNPKIVWRKSLHNVLPELSGVFVFPDVGGIRSKFFWSESLYHPDHVHLH